jgi:hypothetical protein
VDESEKSESGVDAPPITGGSVGPTDEVLATVEALPELVGDDDWDDCGLRWLTSGFPTTTAWQPWPDEGCLAAAHAQGRGARQWFFSRDGDGGAAGWALEMDESGLVTQTDVAYAPDASVERSSTTCTVAELELGFAMPPRCP